MSLFVIKSGAHARRTSQMAIKHHRFSMHPKFSSEMQSLIVARSTYSRSYFNKFEHYIINDYTPALKRSTHFDIDTNSLPFHPHLSHFSLFLLNSFSSSQGTQLSNKMINILVKF